MGLGPHVFKVDADGAEDSRLNAGPKGVVPADGIANVQLARFEFLKQ